MNVMLDGPCSLTGHLDLLDFPSSLVAVLGADGKADVLDQPGDEPGAGERLFLYAFGTVAYIDYRGKDRAKSGRYGLYFHVPDGEYRCLDCGIVEQSPPPWPHTPCTVRRSGFHKLDVKPPSVMEIGV